MDAVVAAAAAIHALHRAMHNPAVKLQHASHVTVNRVRRVNPGVHPHRMTKAVLQQHRTRVVHAMNNRRANINRVATVAHRETVHGMADAYRENHANRIPHHLRWKNLIRQHLSQSRILLRANTNRPACP